VSDGVEYLDLGQVLRQAQHVFLADWIGGETEKREFEFEGRKFSLLHRVLTIVENLYRSETESLEVSVDRSDPVLVSPHSGATTPPAFAAGTRIRVYDSRDLTQQLRSELHPHQNLIWQMYVPPRRVTEGRVLLLVGRYDHNYEAFPGIAGTGILPPELLEEARRMLKLREP
jgi:hypothetical protein